MTRTGAVACTGHSKRTGKACTNPPVTDCTVCRMHGANDDAKVVGQRRLAEARAARTLADVGVRSIGNPLEELAAVTEEARAFAAHVSSILADEAHLDGWNRFDERVLNIYVPLYERALDRVGKLLADWVKLGFDERMVALHERQADLVAQLLRAVLDDPELELTAEQQAVAPVVTKRHLALLKAA